MSEFVKQPDTPDWAAAWEATCEQLRAELRGTQLADMRKRLGITQNLLAKRMGVSQAHVSQIEHGQISGLDTLHTYVIALGGTLDIVAVFGDHIVKMA
ncbi:helix-turn-helix transcriptional regulator [Nonomuraea sp. NPDC046802]|uniref:helix-turn-helix domain-containing protein n=1 Tax=Nonomuraea sp. NPDC046802 TaxID=3154919 RepID=UPI0033C0FA14